MDLNGRNLEFDSQGDDVWSLQDDLALLGRNVPDGERVEGFFGEGTRAAVVDFQVRRGLGETGVVDDALARLITAEADPVRSRMIQGTIAVSGVGPSAGIRVVAVDRDLRSETVLGEAVSGVDGRYEIAYTVEQFRRAEKGGAGTGRADLVIRAMRGDDGAPAATSPVLFNAGLVETIDLVVSVTDDGASEFDRYLAEIVPALDGATLLDLTDDEVDFVVGETGIVREHLVALVAAVRQEGASTGPDGRSGIHLATLYGWFRKGLPTGPGALFVRTPDKLIAALDDRGPVGLPGLGLRQRTHDARRATERSEHAGQRPVLHGPAFLHVYPGRRRSGTMSCQEVDA
jgi:peptidoglycan hydrolase-like protein with peptidoglycan-binding domain